MCQHNRRSRTMAVRCAKRDRKSESGFTLVELLVVLVILVLLASVVGPQVIGYLGSSKAKTAKVQIEALSASLELYRLDNGSYPSSSEGLKALVEQPASKPNWSGPYLRKKKVPPDPWGNDYFYRYPGKQAEFDLYSYGADEKEGGTADASDIVSW